MVGRFEQMPLALSRPKKLDHSDTVRYEIDMLRFAAHRLAEMNLTERDAWVYLEAFLLHYRNLIEFLGNPAPRKRSPADLHVTTIWQVVNLPPPANLDEIHSRGTALFSRYEPKDDQVDGRISQYLQHCTEKRTDAKDWEVSTMMNEIEPLLSEVEKHLGARTFILAPVPAKPLDYFSASTTVHTATAVAPRSIDGSDILLESIPLKKPKDFE